MQRTIGIGWILFFTFILMASWPASVGIAGDTTPEKVKRETVEAYEALKDYTIEQRDEALAASKEELDRMDDQIGKMQKRLDEEWDEMSEETRKKTRATIEVLREKRNNLAEWYGGLRHSSKDAWSEVKKGFVDSYGRMEEALKDAWNELKDD